MNLQTDHPSNMKKLLLGTILAFCLAVPLAVPYAAQAQVVVLVHHHHHHHHHHDHRYLTQ
jgi:hypothetical protein